MTDELEQVTAAQRIREEEEAKRASEIEYEDTQISRGMRDDGEECSSVDTSQPTVSKDFDNE